MPKRIRNMMSHPLDWKDIQINGGDPDPLDLLYISSLVQRGSALHKYLANRINNEIGGNYKRGITFPTLIRVLSIAVRAF